MTPKWLTASILAFAFATGCTGPADSYSKLKLGDPVPGDLRSRGTLVGIRWEQTSKSYNFFPSIRTWESCVTLRDDQGKIVLKSYYGESSYCDGLMIADEQEWQIEVLVPPDWNAKSPDLVSLVKTIFSEEDKIWKAIRGGASTTQDSTSAPTSKSLGESLSEVLSIIERAAPASAPTSPSTTLPRSTAAYVILMAMIAASDYPTELELRDPKMFEGIDSPGSNLVVTDGLVKRLEVRNLGGGRIQISQKWGFTLPLSVYFIGWMIQGG